MLRAIVEPALVPSVALLSVTNDARKFLDRVNVAHSIDAGLDEDLDHTFRANGATNTSGWAASMADVDSLIVEPGARDGIDWANLPARIVAQFGSVRAPPTGR